MNDSEEGYVYSEKFKARVNYQNSSVHIPVEIYEGGKYRFAEMYLYILDKDSRSKGISEPNDFLVGQVDRRNLLITNEYYILNRSK